MGFAAFWRRPSNMASSRKKVSEPARPAKAAKASKPAARQAKGAKAASELKVTLPELTAIVDTYDRNGSNVLEKKERDQLVADFPEERINYRMIRLAHMGLADGTHDDGVDPGHYHEKGVETGTMKEEARSH